MLATRVDASIVDAPPATSDASAPPSTRRREIEGGVGRERLTNHDR
jgi:hypothetical protein